TGELSWAQLDNSSLQIVAPVLPGSESLIVSSLSGPAVFGFTVSNGDLVLQQARDAEFHVSTYAHALHQDVPNVVSLNVDDRTVHVGSHQLIPDEESGEPLQGAAYDQIVFGGASDTTLGPIVVAANRVDQPTHHRMVSLLSALTGAANTVQQDAQHFVPSGYATMDDHGHLLASFRGDRPEQLASVTKVLTCF